jgi:hypothetical protein
LAGCARDPGKEAANSNAALYEAPVPVAQADGSDITTTIAPNGTKAEVRSFPQGQLIQISRASWPDGRQAATVKFRDGRTVDLQDTAEIEQVMTASSDTIAAIALQKMGVTNPQVTTNANQATDEKGGGKGKN